MRFVVHAQEDFLVLQLPPWELPPLEDLPLEAFLPVVQHPRVLQQAVHLVAYPSLPSLFIVFVS
jgi:hypothetical protein